MDLKSVPFFKRPMQSSTRDQWIGQDEAGNNVYKMSNGQTYTVKPDADQRTTRTKVEEDVIPAVKEYAQDPSLPSAEQMKQFGVDAATGAYESLKGAVEGTGTMGDAFGVAPMMAAASSVAEVPEGAIRLFGGARAESPGYSRGVRPLPESFGADGNYRFEIDDSEMYMVPKNIAAYDVSNTQDFSKATTLADVVVHDELFYQYPDLQDMRVVADTSMSPDVWGSFYQRHNLVSVNPELLKPGREQDLKELLLHEVQHKLQSIEGFTNGTNTKAPEVLAVTAERIQSPQNKEAWKQYEQEVKAFADPKKLESPFNIALDFIDEYVRRNKLRIDEEGFIERTKDKMGLGTPRSILENNLKLIRKEVQDSLNALQSAPPSLFDYYTGRMNQVYRTLAGVATGDADAELFMDLTDINPKAITGWQSTADPFDFFYVRPEMPELPAPGATSVDKYVLHSTYERKRGEVEANNVMTRANMTLEERFANSPESTEKYPRDEQWGEAPQYNKGGLVPMDEQMQAFGEAEQVDPVSGNEVPPGSLPEEVRDDVNAKLSEGEYVVPADVVRYFGVGYFEKLRKKAKEAMEEMDEEGRIGGDPVEEDDEDEDDLPFSDDELMAMDDDEEPVKMAEGGFVSGFGDGFQMGADLSAAEQAKQNQNTPNPKAGGDSGSGIRVYVNEAGEQRTIMFVNGQPIQQIPKGFRPMTDKDAAEKGKPNEGGMGTDGTDAGFGNETGPAAEGSGLGGLGGAIGGIAGAVGNAFGGAFGGFGGGGNSGGAGGGSGPDGNAGESGANGGMGGYAARGMLVDKRVKQKPVAKPGKKSLVQRKR